MTDKTDSKNGRTKLVGLVGAACAATLFNCVPKFEGVILRGYRDPIGIVTACAGHTKTAVLGRAYTVEECDKLLVEDLVAHAEGVKECIKPQLTTYQLAASVSFAFNVGVSQFCSSTMAKKFNAGDMKGACAELSRWVHADGKELPGLVARRKVERDMCEGKLQ
jgi:lysozyme